MNSDNNNNNDDEKKKNYHLLDFHVICNKTFVIQVFAIQRSLSIYSARTGEDEQKKVCYHFPKSRREYILLNKIGSFKPPTPAYIPVHTRWIITKHDERFGLLLKILPKSITPTEHLSGPKNNEPVFQGKIQEFESPFHSLTKNSLS